MIITLVICLILLIISIAANIAIGIALNNQFKRIKKYELLIMELDAWTLTTKGHVEDSLNLMRAIDKQGVFSSSISEKGLFESDDLVGQIFKQLTGILDDLNKKINE